MRVQQILKLMKGETRALVESLGGDVQMHESEALSSLDSLYSTLNVLVDRWKIQLPYRREASRFVHALPRGTVYIRTPPSYPLVNGFWALVPALLAGNHVVWNLPAEASRLTRVLQGILKSSGFSQEECQLIRGIKDEGAYLERTSPDMVVFVGSSDGASRYVPSNLRRGAIIETSGANVVWVWGDVFPDSVVDLVFNQVTRHCGQLCNCPRFLFVPREKIQVYEKLLAEKLKAIRYGSTDEPGCMTRLATERYLEYYRGFLAEAEEKATSIMYAPLPPVDFPKPAVVTLSSLESPLLKRAWIGPALVLVSYGQNADVEAVLQRIDIFSLSLLGEVREESLSRLLDNVRAPMLGVNALVRSNAMSRWQGSRDCGCGFLLSPESISQFVRMVSISQPCQTAMLPSVSSANGKGVECADFEVFVRTCGEETLPSCLQAIRAQTNSPVHLVKDVQPVTASFNGCLRAARTKFFFIVDADIVLYPGAVRRMLEVMARVSTNVGVLTPLVWDNFLGENIFAGVKLYRRQCIAGLQYEERLDADSYFNTTVLAAAGFEVLHHMEVLGEHGLREDKYSAYKRSRIRAAKYRWREEHHKVSHGLQKPLIRHLERYGETRDERYLFSVLGGVIGLLAPLRRDRSFGPDEYRNELESLRQLICEDSRT